MSEYQYHEWQAVDRVLTPEDGGYWMEAEANLSYFIRLRADLLEGDYRLLYLAWLKAMTMYGDLYADDGVYRIRAKAVIKDLDNKSLPKIANISDNIQ